MEKSVFDQWIKSLPKNAYRPRNLIVIFKGPDLESAPMGLTVSGERRKELEHFLETMRSLFELQLMRTTVKAVENSTRLLHEDVQKEYTQDFAFVERKDKTIYNLFRQWRAKYQLMFTFDLLMFETDAEFLNVVDAWEVTKLRVDQIRNDYVPRRDLSKAVPEGPHYTTVSLIGDLDHSWDIMEKATVELQKMTISSMNPNHLLVIEAGGL